MSKSIFNRLKRATRDARPRSLRRPAATSGLVRTSGGQGEALAHEATQARGPADSGARGGSLHAGADLRGAEQPRAARPRRRRQHLATFIRFLLSPASQLGAGARAVHWKHMDECTFSWVKEDSNALTVLTGCDCGGAGQLSTASRPMTTSTFTLTLTQLTTASTRYGLTGGTVFTAVRRDWAKKENCLCTCVYHHREVRRPL